MNANISFSIFYSLESNLGLHLFQQWFSFPWNSTIKFQILHIICLRHVFLRTYGQFVQNARSQTQWTFTHMSMHTHTNIRISTSPHNHNLSIRQTDRYAYISAYVHVHIYERSFAILNNRPIVHTSTLMEVKDLNCCLNLFIFVI